MCPIGVTKDRRAGFSECHDQILSDGHQPPRDVQPHGTEGVVECRNWVAREEHHWRGEEGAEQSGKLSNFGEILEDLQVPTYFSGPRIKCYSNENQCTVSRSAGEEQRRRRKESTESSGALTISKHFFLHFFSRTKTTGFWRIFQVQGLNGTVTENSAKVTNVIADLTGVKVCFSQFSENLCPISDCNLVSCGQYMYAISRLSPDVNMLAGEACSTICFFFFWRAVMLASCNTRYRL